MKQNFSILLMQPWVEDFYTTDCRIQPIGLAYLVGSIKKSLPTVKTSFFDALAGGVRSTIPWPKEFQYLKPYYGTHDRSHHKLFHAYYRFGKTEKEIRAFLATHKPDLIAISALFTPYYRESLKLAQLCKEIFPNVPIVMGGNHATLSPETLFFPPKLSKLPKGLCDYILRGEAEESIVTLIRALNGDCSIESVPNLLEASQFSSSDAVVEYCESNSGLISPDHSKLPMPIFDGLQGESYTFEQRKMTFLITSRSCPHHCSFCSIHAVFGSRYTTRSPVDIINEIVYRYTVEGVTHFDIEDDNFTFKKSFVHALLDQIIEISLPITFSAMNGVSYLSLDETILKKMKRAGFSSLNLALVSQDAVVREFSERPHTIDAFYTTVTLATQIGFTITAYLILGMPGQTLVEMVETLKILASQRVLVGASPFYFTPNSPIHKKEHHNKSLMLASSNRDPWFSARLTTMDLESELFSRDDIYTLFRMTRVINRVKELLDTVTPKNRSTIFFQIEILMDTISKGYWSNKGTEIPDFPFAEPIKCLLFSENWKIVGFKSSCEFQVRKK